jgi:hypothetical protein
MFRLWTAVALLTGAALVSCANAGGAAKFKIGDACPPFANLPGIDDKDHSIGDYKKDVLVICITCNHCPVAVAYEDRLVAFAKKYGSKVDIVAINVNNGAQDKLDKMKIRAKDKGFNFDYLYDASQAIGRSLNAHVTPEFYVFDKSRKLVYWGSMDDDITPTKVKSNYLEPAVDAVLAGKAVPTAQTKAFGCGVQYEKK